MQRNVAQCTKCLVLIKNTSRVESHRLKCYGNVVCPDDQSENSILNQTTESIITDQEKDTPSGEAEEDWVSIIASTLPADKEQQDNCKQEVGDMDMDDDDGEEEEVEEYLLMMPSADGDSNVNGRVPRLLH